ncbi:hypothetical protein N7474_010269 [Penicillium riverlandense]|uniref:uncharacterized protein n=1 Tax=Penicillium riverlandense TaxID=1903569 RepID=UPI0025474B06|nr:uncharacterized protein N7474_010269 [Penicillium riverlandense]KAJ5809000.1 hypothetical protein N7474_010269 [Penicillium riverlandense]
MQFIKEHYDLLVPRVFTYEVNKSNPVRAAFILIELLPSIIAIDALSRLKSAERQESLLSACLSSKRSQAIGYSYRAYTSVGKSGAYDRVIEEIERG